MKKLIKKSRAEIHLEFIKSIDKSLNKSGVFEYTKHNPVDKDLDRLRDSELQIKDLFKYKSQIGRVISITGNLIDAIDVKSKEQFQVLRSWIKKL